MSKIGIVILNYNDYKTTIKYIEEIKNYKVLDKIVVVDNNSSDGSYDKLKKYNEGKITVVKTKENRGYSYGNNIGIKELNNDIDYVLISNPDITVSESTIKRLKNDLDNNPDISVISPVINQLGEKIRGWRLSSFKEEVLLNINSYHKKVEQKLKYDDSKYKGNLTKVDVVSGCFFMIRKEIFDAVGNFDEGVFLYYEENILGKKLNTIEKKTFIDNEVEVTHNLSVSVDKSFNSIKKYKMLKDSQKYYAKYYLKINFIQMFLLRFVYRVSLCVSYIICFFKNLRRKK